MKIYFTKMKEFGIKWIIFITLMGCFFGNVKGMENNVPINLGSGKLVTVTQDFTIRDITFYTGELLTIGENTIDNFKKKIVENLTVEEITMMNDMIEKVETSKYTGNLVTVIQNFIIKNITFNKGEVLKIGENDIGGNTVENLDGKKEENLNVDEITIMNENIEKLDICTICYAEELSMLNLKEIIVLKCNHAIFCKQCFMAWFVTRNNKHCPKCRDENTHFDLCHCIFKNKDTDFIKNVITSNIELLEPFMEVLNLYGNNDDNSKSVKKFLEEYEQRELKLTRLFGELKSGAVGHDWFSQMEIVLENLEIEILWNYFIKEKALITMVSRGPYSKMEDVIMLILNRFQEDPNSEDRLLEVLKQENDFGYTILMKSAETSTNLRLIRFILTSFPKDELINFVSKRNPSRNTAFFSALLNGNTQITNMIIQLLASVFENEKQMLADLMMGSDILPNVICNAFLRGDRIENVRALLKPFENHEEINDMILASISSALLHPASRYNSVKSFDYMVRAFEDIYNKEKLIQLIMRKDKNIFHQILDDCSMLSSDKDQQCLEILINQFDNEYNNQFVECMEQIKNSEGKNILENAEKKNKHVFQDIYTMFQKKLITAKQLLAEKKEINEKVIDDDNKINKDE